MHGISATPNKPRTRPPTLQELATRCTLTTLPPKTYKEIISGTAATAPGFEDLRFVFGVAPAAFRAALEFTADLPSEIRELAYLCSSDSPTPMAFALVRRDLAGLENAMQEGAQLLESEMNVLIDSKTGFTRARRT